MSYARVEKRISEVVCAGACEAAARHLSLIKAVEMNAPVMWATYLDGEHVMLVAQTERDEHLQFDGDFPNVAAKLVRAQELCQTYLNRQPVVPATTEVITMAEAAAIAGCSVLVFRRELGAGKLPGTKVGKGWLVFRTPLIEHLSDMARANVNRPKPFQTQPVAHRKPGRPRRAPPVYGKPDLG